MRPKFGIYRQSMLALKNISHPGLVVVDVVLGAGKMTKHELLTLHLYAGVARH